MRFAKHQSALTIALTMVLLLTGAHSNPIDTTPVVVERRGLCTGTGPGVCNLGVAFWLDPTTPNDADDYVFSATIFDRYCNVIGFQDYPSAGECIFSQLPYAVCLDQLDIETQQITFRYAGQTISSNQGECSCTALGSEECWVNGVYYDGDICCQCAFNC
jgi:hypothetical protein